VSDPPIQDADRSFQFACARPGGAGSGLLPPAPEGSLAVDARTSVGSASLRTITIGFLVALLYCLCSTEHSPANPFGSPWILPIGLTVSARRRAAQTSAGIGETALSSNRHVPFHDPIPSPRRTPPDCSPSRGVAKPLSASGASMPTKAPQISPINWETASAGTGSCSKCRRSGR
jgi:hypothetical protein